MSYLMTQKKTENKRHLGQIFNDVKRKSGQK